MPFAARFSQIHLALAHPEPDAIRVGVLGHAMVALAAALIFRALFVGGRQRATAGVATVILPRHQPVTDRNAAIEHITFAIPKRLFGRHLFQVFQDTALQKTSFSPRPNR